MIAIVISPLAESDLSEIADYYLAEAGLGVALAFLAAWRGCTDHISNFPDSGCPRLAEKVRINGIRIWPVKGFPHLAIYQSDAVRATILHSSRDIPASLG